MGSLRHPVGSLPPGVYWFRRSFVVGLLLLAVLGGWWMIGGFSGSPSAASPGPSATSGSPATSRTPTHTSTATRPPTASSNVATCPDSVIRVLAVTGEASYPAGTPVKLTVQVTNTSAGPCKRDLGQAGLELIVYAGTTRVWSSDDCNPGGGHALVTLQPGQTFSSTVQWDRQVSAPGCPSGRGKAPAGAYQLVARSLALRSAPAPFSLG